MFVPSHWAQGFINAGNGAAVGGAVTGVDEAALALELFRLMAATVLSIRGQVAGTMAARRLGELFRRVFAAVPPQGGEAEARSRELALGLITLLVKKDLLRRGDRIIEAIEEELDRRRGILRADLDFARDPGGELTEQLKKALMAKTGASGVRLRTNLVPALLAGCRLRIGSDSIDASLRARLKGLEAELAGAHGGF